MKKKVIEFLVLLGLSEAVGTTIVFALTFLTAYFSPSKSVLITVNTVGEANIEAISLLIIVPLCIYAIILQYRKYIKADAK
jgi:hypothetical protein